MHFSTIISIFVRIRLFQFLYMTVMETKGKLYSSPAMRVVEFQTESVICGSIQAGGNENVGFEDWDD